MEIAIAIWQAQLEFNCLAPLNSQNHANKCQEPFEEEEKVSSFQHFWESEVPRVGEDGAQGWAAFDRSGGLPPEPGASRR